jgi:hypothetical protein
MRVDGNVACIEGNAACDNLSRYRREQLKGFRRLDSRPNNGFAPTEQLDAHKARPLFKAH